MVSIRPLVGLRALVATTLRVVALIAPQAAVRVATSRPARKLAGEGVFRARRLGRPMWLDLADNVQRTLLLAGTYEPELLAYIRGELRKGDVYIDIGGHIGIHAVVAGKRLQQLGGGQVYCFEPAADSVIKIRQATGGLPVEVVETAVGQTPGQTELRADTSFGSRDAATRSFFNDGEVIAVVSVVRFDDWATESRLQRMDLVKLDVEGAEHDALEGMAESITQLKPRSVIVELEPRRLEQAGRTIEEITDFMATLGYRRASQIGTNAVFCP